MMTWPLQPRLNAARRSAGLGGFRPCARLCAGLLFWSLTAAGLNWCAQAGSPSTPNACWPFAFGRLAAADAPRDGAYTEKFPAGGNKIQAYYHAGKLVGSYQEYWESGRIKIRTNYTDGLLNGLYQSFGDDGKEIEQATYVNGVREGAYTAFFPNGRIKIRATYADGELQGHYQTFDEKTGQPTQDIFYVYGQVPFTRTAAQLQNQLNTIATDTYRSLNLAPASTAGAPTGARGSAGPAGPAGATGSAGPAELAAALVRLKQARAIAGVPYTDITLKDDYNTEAQAASKVLAALGHLDHHPPHPAGIDDATYRLGQSGCANGNLAEGFPQLPQAVNLWLFDSDDTNKPVLGHRRWSLNPAMLQIGFGRDGKYSAEWAHDTARPTVPDFTAVAWPAAGYHPVGFFGPRWCWNVSLNPAHFQAPVKADIKVKMYALDTAYRKSGPPLDLDWFTVNTDGYGVPYAVIWRPKSVDVSPGRAYLVTIDGLKDAAGKPTSYSYVVEFVS
ncbi:MAG: hypothetical protein ACREJ2_01490 [Planctomycetota bacterium]